MSEGWIFHQPVLEAGGSAENARRWKRRLVFGAAIALQVLAVVAFLIFSIYSEAKENVPPRPAAPPPTLEKQAPKKQTRAKAEVVAQCIVLRPVA